MGAEWVVHKTYSKHYRKQNSTKSKSTKVKRGMIFMVI